MVCEGHTERDYFEHLNKYGTDFGFALHLIPKSQRRDQAFDPLSAVETAVRRARELRGVQRLNVWAVFDRDEHTGIYDACRLARQEKINIAFSHPNFELWLWLHFAVGLPPKLRGDRDWVPARLAKIDGFEDFGKRLNERQTDLLYDNRGRAVRLARELVSACPSGLCSCDGKKAGEPAHATNCDVLIRDPSTDVYRILESLGLVESRSEFG